jgi:hypothetical protein
MEWAWRQWQKMADILVSWKDNHFIDEITSLK